MRVIIDQRVPVTVRCECGAVGLVQDLMAAVHWAFLEGLRHGPGCHLDIDVDILLHVEHIHAGGQPGAPG